MYIYNMGKVFKNSQFNSVRAKEYNIKSFGIANCRHFIF